MKTTWNQHVVKMSNKSLVLQIIRSEAPLSRAEIAQQTGLNKGTVSSLVQELIDEQLCCETGPGESSGGRRPVMLLFNQTAGYAIGLDVGVHYVLGVLTDLQGNVVQEIHTPYSDTSYSQVVDVIKETIRSLIKEAPPSHFGIIGIGLGVPGIVDPEGKILFAPNLSWREVDLKRELEREFILPVLIENEANAGAYGEKHFGAGQNHDHLIYISAGIGIGIGLILNQELYRGHYGLSGEMGHMIIETHGHSCRCGSKGCWEMYASEAALLDQSSAHSLEELLHLAQQGDQKTIEEFRKIGVYLGVGINNIVNTFNPSQVIIGNRLALAKEWIEAPMQEIIESHSLPYHKERVEVAFAELSIYSTARGISAFVIENFLKQEYARN